MKRIACVLAAGLVLASVAPAFAQVSRAKVSRAPAKLTRMEGWVVDQWDGSKNARVEAKDRILANHEKGAVLVFVSKEGTIYSLEDQEKALENVGFKVQVLGSVDDDRNLRVGTYKPVEEKKTEDGS